jgi:hypothetical protein
MMGKESVVKVLRNFPDSSNAQILIRCYKPGIKCLAISDQGKNSHLVKDRSFTWVGLGSQFRLRTNGVRQM